MSVVWVIPATLVVSTVQDPEPRRASATPPTIPAPERWAGRDTPDTAGCGHSKALKSSRRTLVPRRLEWHVASGAIGASDAEAEPPADAATEPD